MAACGSVQHIFDNIPLDPPKPLLSCKHILPMNALDNSPTDVFSGFDINEKTESIASSTERLSEALGFESFDDVEDVNDQWEERYEYTLRHVKTGVLSLPKRSRISGKEIPPPISSIGRRVCFKSYRFNGRLVLKEEKIPTQEILHAFREDGRLKLQFIRFDDDMAGERERESRAKFGNGNGNGNDGDNTEERDRERTKVKAAEG